MQSLFEDSGFPLNSRNRIIHVMVHKIKASIVGDISRVYDAIANELKKEEPMPMPALFWDNDPENLRKEMVKYGHTQDRGWQGFKCPVDDWTSLLTNKEKATRSSVTCVPIYYIYRYFHTRNARKLDGAMHAHACVHLCIYIYAYKCRRGEMRTTNMERDALD